MLKGRVTPWLLRGAIAVRTAVAVTAVFFVTGCSQGAVTAICSMVIAG